MTDAECVLNKLFGTPLDGDAWFSVPVWLVSRQLDHEGVQEASVWILKNEGEDGKPRWSCSIRVLHPEDSDRDLETWFVDLFLDRDVNVVILGAIGIKNAIKLANLRRSEVKNE